MSSSSSSAKTSDQAYAYARLIVDRLTQEGEKLNPANVTTANLKTYVQTMREKNDMKFQDSVFKKNLRNLQLETKNRERYKLCWTWTIDPLMNTNQFSPKKAVKGITEEQVNELAASINLPFSMAQCATLVAKYHNDNVLHYRAYKALEQTVPVKIVENYWISHLLNHYRRCTEHSCWELANWKARSEEKPVHQIYVRLIKDLRDMDNDKFHMVSWDGKFSKKTFGEFKKMSTEQQKKW